MKVAIGQDSHRFDFESKTRKLILGGIIFEDSTPLAGNSDADVVLHSITNAVSGITCKNILGKIADDMCKSGITDSEEYIKSLGEFDLIESENVKIIDGVNTKIFNKPIITKITDLSAVFDNARMHGRHAAISHHCWR